MRKAKQQKQQRKYSDVRVKDPNSDNHVVPLHPGQDFNIVLSSTMGEVAVDVESDFFDLTETVETAARGQEKETVLKFSQFKDLSKWSQISKVYLGAVRLLSEMRDDFVNLSVFLESSNPLKENVITIINPEQNKLKVEAHQILEVVVYGSRKFFCPKGSVSKTYFDTKYDKVPT